MQVAVRYHEIALKGRNRPFFVGKLAENLRLATSDLGSTRARVRAGGLVIEVDDNAPWETVRDRIASVCGVANFGRVHETAADVETLKSAVVTALALLTTPAATFRVSTTRSYKQFPLTSMEIDRVLGGAIKAATGMRVSLDDSELTVYVEVQKDRISYSFERFAGPGGFAVGSSGRLLALVSGGIDSPVACYRMMKRGCRVVPVHFHAFPLQDRTTIDKARRLAEVLTRFQYGTRLLLVPFAPVQQTIVANCPAPLRVVLYRRFMVRIAEALARKHGAKALVTGESLGQVASQTLDNIAAIDAAAAGPILRPLVGMDKEEIVREARRIGTLEISTLPDQDCCQLFVPKSPATAAKLDELLRAETALEVAALVSAAVGATEEERFSFPAGIVPPDAVPASTLAGPPSAILRT